MPERSERNGYNYEYYFTDITKYFLPGAKKMFKNNSKVIIKQFNVDEDYTKQGFQPNYFDIIIGAYVLENVKNIQKSIGIIKDLIAPQGYLLFSEPVRNEPWILTSQALMMTKPEDDYRKNTFFVDPDCWKKVLDTCDNSSCTQSFPSKKSSLYSLGAVLFVKQFKTNKSIINREKNIRGILKYIPEYMKPTTLLYLESFPLTLNGKIDTKKMLEYIPRDIDSSLESFNEERAANELEKNILMVWKDILGIDQLGISDNFYDFGADSLLMAQEVTKMREKFSLEIPFETLLRNMINNPTAHKCAEYISNYKGDDETDNKEEQNEINSLYFVKKYSDFESEGVRVLVHGAIGSIENYAHLVKELLKYDSRNIIAFGISDYTKYMQIKTDSLLLELAEQYTRYIIEHRWKKIQLIGYSFSGGIVLEMARLLLEQDINVDSVVIIEGGTIPVSIESNIIIEMLFLDSLGISEKTLGFKQKEILKNIFDVVKSGDLEKLDDNILKNILILEEDREQLQYLLSTSQIQRFDSYQKK